MESGHNIGPSTGQLREQLDAYATSSDCFSEMAGEDGTIYETFYGINKDGRFGSFINHLIMSAECQPLLSCLIITISLAFTGRLWLL